MSNNPKNLYSYENVIISSSDVHKKKVDIHHFIPLKSEINKKYKFPNIDEICNLALIDTQENRNEIGCKDIDIYLSEAKNNNNNFKENLNSHFLNYELIKPLLSYKKLATNEIYDLVEKIYYERAKLIHEKIIEIFFNS